jgi:hypothetical protein
MLQGKVGHVMEDAAICAPITKPLAQKVQLVSIMMRNHQMISNCN